MGYKIYLDFSSVNAGMLYMALKDVGEVLMSGKEVYVWLSPGKTKESITAALRGHGIKDFFCQEIKQQDIKGGTGFVASWFSERFSKEAVTKMEEAKQAELQQMLDNIRKANELLDQKIEESKINEKEAPSNGRDEGNED